MSRERTLADDVYQLLKKAIVESTLKPGEKLSEAQLARTYNVSRAPIRDAIAKLRQERLVIVKPQIGTIVSPVSPRKALDILQVRLLLEPFAAEVAAPNVTDADLEELEEQFARLDKVRRTDERYLGMFYETDARLHQLIWKRCGNMEIYDILDNYRGEIQRIRISSSDLSHRLTLRAHEIRDVLNALKERSGIRARLTMALHILNTRSTVEEFVQEYSTQRGVSSTVIEPSE